jgi:hypothetical protein
MAIPPTARPGNGPRITPTRQSLDNRFPVLAFTIHRDDREYFEVLLATDRSLFVPGNAARRNAGNFYSSRQDSGLVRAVGPTSVYLAPAAALRAFAQATPRPSAIYYTLITYRTANGTDPAFAQPPEALPTSAPSVSVSADFRAQTLANAMGVHISMLRRFHGQEQAAAPAPPAEVSAKDDAGEGEDGANREPTAQSAALPSFATPPGLRQGQRAVEVGSALARPAGNGHNGHRGTTSAAAPPAEDIAYDDGYGAFSEEEALWEGAQESDYPPDAPEPDYLEGDDGSDDDYGDESQAAYDEPPAPAARGRALGWRDEDEDGEAGDGDYPSDRDLSAYADEAEGYQFEEGASTYQALDAPGDGGTVPVAAAPPPLQIADKLRIIERVAKAESGRDTYSAINADGEFEGRFGKKHPAYQRYHIGLSFGIIQFTQDSGNLARLLTLMRQRDAAEFDRIFGPKAADLLAVTGAPGPPSAEVKGGRSARVQPVDGADLWEEPWLSRFRQAGKHRPFQAAQNELAATLFLDPMLRFAGWLGLDTERALSVVVDRGVQMGVGGAQRWIIGAVGPAQTAAQRQQALAALKYPDLRQFQAATPGLTADGDWGPLSHAALVAALRGLGSASPVPVPSRDQMLDALVRHAAGQPWADRVKRLRNLTDAGLDTPYQLI